MDIPERERGDHDQGPDRAARRGAPRTARNTCLLDGHARPRRLRLRGLALSCACGARFWFIKHLSSFKSTASSNGKRRCDAGSNPSRAPPQPRPLLEQLPTLRDDRFGVRLFAMLSSSDGNISSSRVDGTQDERNQRPASALPTRSVQNSTPALLEAGLIVLFPSALFDWNTAALEISAAAPL